MLGVAGGGGGALVEAGAEQDPCIHTTLTTDGSRQGVVMGRGGEG